MSNLFALSRELRDLIYIFVLSTSDNPPPSSPADCGERQKVKEEISQGCDIYFPHPVHVSSAALLLVNRQIHAEFSPWVTRLKKSGPVRYKLDCMLYEEESIYPTWLSVPVKAERIDVLEVDFRLLGDPEGDRLGLMCEWEGDYGGHSPILWGLWALLNRFLTRGPDFLSCEKDEQRIEVERLVLNVIDTSLPDEITIWGSDRSSNGVMHSENVVWQIRHAIKCLLEISHTSDWNLEGVKTVVLCDDGVEETRWNLQDRPARLRAFNSS